MRTTLIAILATFALIVAIGTYAAIGIATHSAQAAPCAQTFSTSATCAR